jgi:hypothetical protein
MPGADYAQKGLCVMSSAMIHFTARPTQSLSQAPRGDGMLQVRWRVRPGIALGATMNDLDGSGSLPLSGQ